MISYEVYKLLHILGIVLIFLSLGGVTLHATNGGTRAASKTRGLVAATHGLGVLIVLVAGFGLLARIGGEWGGWLWVKLGVWILLAGLLMLPYRRPAAARSLWIVIPTLGAVAAYMAIFKPF